MNYLPQTISKQTTVKLFDHFNFDKIKDVYTEKTKAPWKKPYPRIIQVDVTCVALSLESKLRELFSLTCKYQPHTRRRVSNCKERRWTRVPQRQQKKKKDLNKVKQSDDDDNVDDSGAGCCYCYLRELTFVNWVILTEWEQSIQREPLVVCALFHYKTLPLSTDSF